MTEATKSSLTTKTVNCKTEKKFKNNEANSSQDLVLCSNSQRRILNKNRSSSPVVNLRRVFSALTPTNKSSKETDGTIRTRARTCESRSPIHKTQEESKMPICESSIQYQKKDKEINTRLIVRCGRNVMCKDFLPSEVKYGKTDSPKHLLKDSTYTSDESLKLDSISDECKYSEKDSFEFNTHSPKRSAPNRLSFRRNILQHSSGSDDVSHTFPSKVESGAHYIRSTKASRLRAMANNSLLETSPSKSDFLNKQVSSNAKQSAYSDSGLALPSKYSVNDTSIAVTDMNENVTNKSANKKNASSIVQKSAYTISNSESKNDGLKDKSSKRKSNLNRAIILEEPRLVPFDSQGDLNVRKQQTYLENDIQKSRLEQRKFSVPCATVYQSQQVGQSTKFSNNNKYDSRFNRKIDDCRQSPEHQKQKIRTNKLFQQSQVTAQRNSPCKEKSVINIHEQDSILLSTNKAVTENCQTSSMKNRTLKDLNILSSPTYKISRKLEYDYDHDHINNQSDSMKNIEDDKTLSEFCSKTQELIDSILECKKQIEESTNLAINLNNGHEVKCDNTNKQSVTIINDKSDHFNDYQSPAIHSISLKLSNPTYTTTTIWNSVTMDSSDDKSNHSINEISNSVKVPEKANLNWPNNELKNVNNLSNYDSFKSEHLTLADQKNGKQFIRPRTKSLEHIKYTSRQLESETKQPTSILKRKSFDEQDTESVLKTVLQDSELIRKPHSILKKRGSSDEKEYCAPSSELHSILKKASIEDGRARSSSSPEIHPILKHRSFDDGSNVIGPRPILKKKSSVEDIQLDPVKSEPRPILKKKYSLDDDLEERPRPILKSRRKSHDERNLQEVDIGVRSILRRTSAEDIFKTTTPLCNDSASNLISAYEVLKNHTDEFVNDVSSAKNVVIDDFQTPSELSKHTGAVFKSKLNTQIPSSSSILRKHYIKPIFAYNESLSKDQIIEPVNLLTKEQLLQEENVSGVMIDKIMKKSSSENSLKEDHIKTSQNMQSSEKLKPANNEISSWRTRFDRRNVARYHTQPVTSGEINETDSLESVQAFRSLVLKKTSFNIFKELETELPSKTELKYSKTEYPQHYRPDKQKNRRQGNRYRTLPVSLEKICETEKIEPLPMATKKSKVASVEESVTKETSNSDELSQMSVAAKKSLFQKLEIEQKPSNIRSRIDLRRRAPRSQTQPITEEELHQASKMVEDECSRRNSEEIEPKTIAKVTEPVSINTTTSDSEDDPSKLSLADKMKLFSQKVTGEMLKPGPQPRRNRSLARFKTQPITFEEIDKAATLTSPDTTTESKQPFESCDTSVKEILQKQGVKTMPCISQLKAVLESRQQMMQKEEEEEDPKQKGILKTSKDSGSIDIKGILKHDGPQLLDSKELSRELKGILKTIEDSHGEDKPLRSVLKKAEKEEESDLKSILKSELNSDSDASDSTLSSSDDDSEEDKKSNKYEGPKNVLIGGQSHLVINPISRQELSPSRKIANPAIQRRLNAALRKKEDKKSVHELRSHSIITSSTSTQIDNEKTVTVKSHSTTDTEFIPPQRSFTQPVISSEKEDCVKSSGGSIAERLAALHRNGEEQWRKRLTTLKTDNPEEEINTSPIHSSKKSLNSQNQRPSSIADRLSLLEVAQDQWRARVEEKDTTKFTVAGKMGQIAPQQSPLLDRERRHPKPVKFRSKTSNIDEVIRNSGSPQHKGSPISKSKSMPNALRKDTTINNISSSSSSESEDDLSATRVLVPKADNETFTSFFESVVTKKSEEKIEINEDVLKEITSESHQLLAQRKSIRLQSRRSATRNPIRALASRTDLQQEYLEVKTGAAERELQSVKVKQLSKTSDLALSALAGLASTEDFKAVTLKKSNTSEGCALLPIKDVMLVQVKGRRHIQTRLVEPKASSINQGDCYILVTHNQVFNLIGKYSNIIERAKSVEIASTVQLKKDLCFKGTADVITIDETKNPSPNIKEIFFNILNGKESDSCPAGNPEEDEIYEAFIIDTNMVYCVEDDTLSPYQEFWGSLPRIEMLQPDKVLVFDFGSEMYIWQGKIAPFEKRKIAVLLAKELWEQGYDYSECDINPLNASLEQKISLKGSKRPDWAVFTKINQHMEPVLFKEKFFDWPDLSRIIKVKSQEIDETKSDDILDLKPCNTKEMLEQKPPEPDLVLEGSHLGRGTEYFDSVERRHYEITTLAIKIWHILEYDHNLLPELSYGQFHNGDTYVVRWQYMITQTGRDLSGQMSRHSFVGRERCAYFFWQGNESTITEKGASALMTVELDEERGPQIRVIQEKELPCFLNLFEGGMVIHKGKREDYLNRKKERWRLFMLKGEIPQEAVLIEVLCNTQSLRSRSSFTLIDTNEGIIYVWHGCKSTKHSREAVLKAVNKLLDKKPQEMFQKHIKLIMKEIEEGSESKEFWQGLGGRNRHMYLSLLDNTLAFDFAPRLFYMNSISGNFTYTEIVCPHYSKKYSCPYPFLQSDLYKAQQPALFLLDNEYAVYLWQGWWPEGTEDTENVSTGSAVVRWNNDRRCAMETALHYCQNKCHDNPPKTYLISAGLEPAVFTNLFPHWQQRDDVAILNIKDGKKPGEMLFVQEVLAQLTRMHYPLSELQQQPLPEGVNPSRLESYLTDQDFEEVFKVSKDEFYNLPTWKQCNMKKSVKLF